MLAKYRSDIDPWQRLFDASFFDLWSPTTPRYERRTSTKYVSDADSYVISMPALGLAADDIELEEESGILRVRMGSTDAKSITKFSLNEDADAERIEASLSRGLLTVTIPKSTKRASARSIKVIENRP